MPRGPKYQIPTEPEPALSEADERRLARLVRKYGRELVAERALVVKPRARGRPVGSGKDGDDPRLTKMHEADWIEEVAEEYRQAGSLSPYTDAELELFVLQFGEAEAGKLAEWRENLRRFRTTLKRKRYQARRDREQARASAARLAPKRHKKQRG